jgi:hypothetical protein
MDEQLKAWRADAKHLPDFLKDFHDQKDFFKMMHERLTTDDNSYTKDISWVAGQIYTVDMFLWYCAKFGYTLQRSRAKQNFEDLDQAISANNNQRNDHFANLLLGAIKKEEPPAE